jgi:hypothetical protein
MPAAFKTLAFLFFASNRKRPDARGETICTGNRDAGVLGRAGMWDAHPLT